MTTFAEQAQSLAATAAEIAKLKGAVLEASLLTQARASLVETGYDNWNGGTEIYSLLLQVPVNLYAEIEDQKAQIEQSIHRRIEQLTRASVGVSISEIVVSPTLVDHARPPLPAVDGEPSPTADIGADPISVPSFWEPGNFRLFISHASEKKDSAHRLKDALAGFQIVAFVAHDDIEPALEWQAEIETALRTMDALVALISPAFRGSQWCDQEVGVALGRSKLVIPLRVGADPHGFTGKLQGLQTKGLDAPAIASRIVEILMKSDLSCQRMTEALVERLVQSRSWDSSKRTVVLLGKAKRLTTAQAGRLLQAIDENSQVGGAFGVPEQIREIVGKVAPDNGA